jgi:hypothetical protein
LGGAAYSAEMRTKFWLEGLKGRGHLQDARVDGRKKKKMDLRKIGLERVD